MNKIFLIALFVPFFCFGQYPKVMKDSVFFHYDVYVQTLDQEAVQQAKIFGYERKIEKLKTIIHKRKKIEPIIDSLFIEIEGLEQQRDSLDSLVRVGSLSIVKSASNDLVSIRVKLQDARIRIITLKKLLATYRRYCIQLIIIIAIETGIIILF